MEEIWKVFKDTRYATHGFLWEVSDQGNVKKNSVPYECKLLNSGYKVFGRGYSVHRAVAMLFIPNPENKPCVDHINGNRLDNRAINLRWVTPKENNNNPIYIKRRTGLCYKQRSEETRNKISEAMKNWYKEHPEFNKRENNPMYGIRRHRVYHGDGTYHYEKNL